MMIEFFIRFFVLSLYFFSLFKEFQLIIFFPQNQQLKVKSTSKEEKLQETRICMMEKNML